MIDLKKIKKSEYYDFIKICNRLLSKLTNRCSSMILTIPTYSLVLTVMIRTLYRYLFFLWLLIPGTCFLATAQNLTGIWRGYFITEFNDQYKFELQVSQKNSSISGVSYSYLSTVFYGKATLTGSFNKTGQNALVREIKTIELRMDGGSSACIMKCIFQYERSGKEEFLEGTFTSKFEKNGILNKKGADCGGGKVYLRKVTTSDFYVEPFLRGKIKSTTPVTNTTPTRSDSLKKTTTNPVAKKPVSKPIVKTNAPPVKKTINKPITKTTTPTVKKTGNSNTTTTKTNSSTSKIIVAPIPKIDSAQKTQIPITKTNPPANISVTPDALKNRKNELVKTLIVNDPNVIVKLYDNGEIDDDTISVYMDKKLVLAAKRLTASPLVVKLKMDEDNSEHELVMVAENLGRIPPNTSLMTVESGEQRFEVRITSTEQKNAVVRFKYQKQN